jgi:hypothetical protein
LNLISSVKGMRSKANYFELITSMTRIGVGEMCANAHEWHINEINIDKLVHPVRYNQWVFEEVHIHFHKRVVLGPSSLLLVQLLVVFLVHNSVFHRRDNWRFFVFGHRCRWYLCFIKGDDHVGQST